MASKPEKKVASSPQKAQTSPKTLKPLALRQLAEALAEGGISVSELLRILALPELDSEPGFPLPDGWRLYHEE